MDKRTFFIGFISSLITSFIYLVIYFLFFKSPVFVDCGNGYQVRPPLACPLVGLTTEKL